MKKRKTRISGEVTSSHQNCLPSIGPTCQAAVMVWPLAASTPIPAANASQNPTAISSRCSRRRMRKPPTTINTSARTSAGDSGPHHSASGSARCAPRRRKHSTRPKFDGLKMWLATHADQILREQSDRGRSREDPPALHAPPVAVLRARHSEDERDAIAGQQCARRPHDHVLASERDRELENAGSDERDEDLGDRQAEVEGDLAEHLQRDDHGCEMQPRVAERGQQDRVLRAPEAQRRAFRLARARSFGAHRTAACGNEKALDSRSKTARGVSAIGQYGRQWPSLRPATTLSSPSC